MNGKLKKSLIATALITSLTGVAVAQEFKAVIYAYKGAWYITPNPDDTLTGGNKPGEGNEGGGGTNPPDGGGTTPDKPNTSGWIAFLQAHNQWNGYLTETDIKATDNIMLTGYRYSNEDLPTGTVGVPELSTIQLTRNSIDDLSFLNGTKIKTLLSDENPITDFSSFPQEDYFLLSLKKNNITDLSMLSHLKNVKYLYLQDNPFTSIKPLENIESADIIRISSDVKSLDEYTNKLDLSSNFCQKIKTNEISIYKDYKKESAILLCDISDDWVVFLHGHNQLTSITDSSEITISSTINLSNKGLNDADMPLYPLTTGDGAVRTFNLMNNNLTHVNFFSELTKTQATSSSYGINLENNPISDPSGLSGLTEVGHIKFSDAATFTNLSSFYNLTKGYVYLDRDLRDFEEYANNIDYNSPLCQGIANGQVNLIYLNAGSVEKMEICETGDEWMDFLHDNGVVRELGTQADITELTIMNLNNKGLNDEDLPQSSLKSGDGSISILNLADNNLTHVNFLSDFTKTYSKGSQYGIDLRGNPISDISGLSNLTEFGHLKFDSDSSFTSLSPLANVTKGYLYLGRNLEEFEEYTNKFNYSDSFCQSMASNDLTLYFNNSSTTSKFNLCTTGNEWLDFLHGHDQVTKRGSLSEITDLDLIRLTNKGLSNADLPTGVLDISAVGAIDLENNNLTNVDFLSNLTRLRDGGSSSYYIDLQRNALSDISGLSKLTLAPLIDFRNSNNTFTDLSPLVNLTKGSIRLDRDFSVFDQKANKWSYSTPICTGLKSNAVTIVANGSNNGKSLCTTGEAWMDLFYMANLFKSYETVNDVPESEINYTSQNFANDGLKDEDMPSTLYPFNNIKGIDLSFNELTHVNFFSSLTDMKTPKSFSDGNIIDLEGNDITDISGLSNLRNASVKLNGTLITDLSPLKDLQTGFIRISDKTVAELDKLPISSSFCQNLENASKDIRLLTSGSYYATQSDICE